MDLSEYPPDYLLGLGAGLEEVFDALSSEPVVGVQHVYMGNVNPCRLPELGYTPTGC